MGEFSDLIFTAAGFFASKDIGEDRPVRKDYTREQAVRTKAVRLQKRLSENINKIGEFKKYIYSKTSKKYGKEYSGYTDYTKIIMGVSFVEFQGSDADWYERLEGDEVDSKNWWDINEKLKPLNVQWKCLEVQYRNNPYLLWKYKKKRTWLGSKFIKLKHANDGRELEELSADTIGKDRVGFKYAARVGYDCYDTRGWSMYNKYNMENDREKYNIGVSQKKGFGAMRAMYALDGIECLDDVISDVYSRFPDPTDNNTLIGCYYNGKFHNT